MICTADDTFDYVIKDTLDGAAPLLPHCEWFCSQLSESVNIAAPQHKIIQLPDGSYVFGSRWISGVLKPQLGGYWYDRVKSGDIPLDKLTPTLSRIFAFDQFVANMDRHANNFMAEPQQQGFAILAMDYSQAWIQNGFPLPAIPLKMCMTVLEQRMLVELWGKEFLIQEEVDAVLTKIRSIPKSRISRILKEQPEEWLSEQKCDAILKWWKSPDMLKRIKAISAGVKSGACL